MIDKKTQSIINDLADHAKAQLTAQFPELQHAHPSKVATLHVHLRRTFESIFETHKTTERNASHEQQTERSPD